MSDRELLTLSEVVARGLSEDIGDGDVTSEALIAAGTRATGKFVARESGVIAGLCCVTEVYRQLDESIQVRLHRSDGDRAEDSDELATVFGLARQVLAGERVALNLLGRLSGIATLTRQFVDRLVGTSARILDTRKTTPGLRELEKYAVAMGGGENHRMGLFDQVLIKDNHLAAIGGRDLTARIVDAIGKARGKFDGVVQVEVDRLEDVVPAATAGADTVLLDNFPTDDLAAAVQAVREAIPDRRQRPLLEASGGVRLETVRAIAQTGVDRISVGALTHSARALDIGLDFELHP